MPKREPDQVWKTVVKEAADDEREFQRAASATAEEVDASLRAKGVDPKAVRAEAGEWRREIEQRVAARKARAAAETRARTRSVRPQRRASPMFLLIAAVVGAAVGGGLVYAMTRPAPPPTPEAPAPPAPSLSPEPIESAFPNLVSVDTLRHDALAACDAHKWAECLAGLDRARDEDPAGDNKQLQDARLRAIEEIQRKSPR